MTNTIKLAALAALVTAGLGAGLTGQAEATTQFKTFEVASWTCAGSAIGVYSQNCKAVADYFCKKKGYDAHVTFHFSWTDGKVSRYSSIAKKPDLYNP
ncbi:MAG: hypothetical protein ACE5FM_07980 [Methyloligellaceae bacterium]